VATFVHAQRKYGPNNLKYYKIHSDAKNCNRVDVCTEYTEKSGTEKCCSDMTKPKHHIKNTNILYEQIRTDRAFYMNE